ncbi:MAG: transposase [Nitrososphaerales archaeon]
MEFKELADEQWRYVEPFLPPPARTGRPRADDRATVNGVIYVLTTGCRWMDMPSKYGSYKTVWRRLKKWEKKDVWKRVLDSLITRRYSSGKLSLAEVAVDSTTVEAKKGGSSSVSMDT